MKKFIKKKKLEDTDAGTRFRWSDLTAPLGAVGYYEDPLGDYLLITDDLNPPKIVQMSTGRLEVRPDYLFFKIKEKTKNDYETGDTFTIETGKDGSYYYEYLGPPSVCIEPDRVCVIVDMGGVKRFAKLLPDYPISPQSAPSKRSG